MSGIGTGAGAPPFSPLLLVAMALRPVPARLFSPLVKRILRRMEALYPAIFDRLTPLGRCRFHIIPTDFHYSFVVELNSGAAMIDILRGPKTDIAIDATISGSMLSLLKLLEGRVDGDALFFSRELVVEGDTEAVLTLRNAVDSVDISLEEVFFEYAGPLRPVALAAAKKASLLFNALHDDFDLLRRSLMGPIPRMISQQNEDLDRMEKQIKQLEKEFKKFKTRNKKYTATTEIS